MPLYAPCVPLRMTGVERGLESLLKKFEAARLPLACGCSDGGQKHDEPVIHKVSATASEEVSYTSAVAVEHTHTHTRAASHGNEVDPFTDHN
jgi:hypothetical protein